MKTILTAVLVSIICISAIAQGNIQFSAAVVNNKGVKAPNISIIAMETSTLKTVTGKTNAEGKVELKLNDGKEWAVSVGEMKKYLYLVSEPDRLMLSNKFIVYDPKDYQRKKRQDNNRSNEKFKEIPQTAKEDTDFKPGTCFLMVTLKEPRGKVGVNVPVALVNVKDSLLYTARTNDQGKAFFIVPNKTNYEIDIGEIKNYGYCDFGDEYLSQSIGYGFAPTIAKEKVVNDTTFQELNDQSRPSSERTLLKITVSGGKKNGNHERVYLRQLASGKVYASTSNDQGVAYFLVPIKHIYIVDFNYHKNVDGINLSHVNDITTGQMRIHYNPDPRLEYPETFIPTPQTLLFKNFNDFLVKQYPRPKDQPFTLEIKSINPIHKASREALFMLTMSGADKYGNVRLPLNTALVLDKSGSMFSNERSESLKKALLAIGSALTDTDIVSVILFDESAFEVHHSLKNHLEGLQNISQNYMPGGGTDIFEGLQKGAESLQKNFDKNRSNKIILLTDGYDHTPPQDITDFVEAKFREGIEFSAIGLGKDYNQALLELIALKGNGTFNYVDNSGLLSDVIMKEVKGSFGYSAKDLKIDIYHNEKLIFSQLLGYPLKSKTTKNISFEIGKVPYNTNRLAFLKFKLNNPSQELEASPLQVKVSYFDLAKNQSVSLQQEIKLRWTDETDTELMLDQEEKKLYGIAILNQSMKRMAEAYENKDIKAARNALEQGKTQVEGMFPSAKPEDLKTVFEEVDRYLGLLRQIEKNN